MLSTKSCIGSQTEPIIVPIVQIPLWFDYDFNGI